MLMFYKKSLPNHAHKVLSMLLLMYILPFITPKLSEMQAGFHKGRGCRNNILILVMTVHHLLKSAEQGISKESLHTSISQQLSIQSLTPFFYNHSETMRYLQNTAGLYNLFTNQQQLKFGFKNQVDIEPTHAKSTCQDE